MFQLQKAAHATIAATIHSDLEPGRGQSQVSIETDKFIREYFEARPQLEPPAYSGIVGYAIPAPCLHMIESLLEERRRGSAEVRRLHNLVGALYEYKGLVEIGSAEAIGEAEARISEAESTVSGSPTPKSKSQEKRFAHQNND